MKNGIKIYQKGACTVEHRKLMKHLMHLFGIVASKLSSLARQFWISMWRLQWLILMMVHPVYLKYHAENWTPYWIF